MCMYLTTSHTHFPIKKCLPAVCYLCPPHHFLCSIGCATLFFALCVLPTLQQPLQMLLYASALSFPQFPPYQPPSPSFPFNHPFRPALWRFQHFFIVGIKKKGVFANCVKYEKHLCKLQRVQLMYKKCRKMLENTFCIFFDLQRSCNESNECVPMNNHEYLCRVTVQQTF